MKATVIIVLCLLLSACTVKTEIRRLDDGYIVKSKRNALVVMTSKKTGEQFTIDNRNLWYLEMLLSGAVMGANNSIHVELDDLDAVEGD